MFQNNNILTIFQQFQQFKKSMQGKDPNAVLQELIDNGKVTQSQIDQARKMAEQFKDLLK